MNNTTYSLAEWLQWLEQQHPSHKIELGLARIAQVKQTLLGNKTIAKQVITVAGTNGKGSSVAFLGAICQAAGLRYATFTSPHLLRFNERIAINGQPVSDAQLCTSFVRVNKARYQAATIPVELTYFEFNALLAFDIMQAASLDVAILEVGLGGRLDATNIIDPDIALVTSIGLDHQDWLGSNLDTIGREKAGIFRSHKPAIFAQAQGVGSVKAYAQSIAAQFYQVGEQFGVHTDTYTDKDNADKDTHVTYWWQQSAGAESENITQLPILASCWNQITLPRINIAGVVQAVKLLPFSISDKAIVEGLAQATVLGRMQRLVWQERQVILDVAHNPQAATYIIEHWPHADAQGKLHCVFGALADKDYVAVIACLQARVDAWYFGTTQGERGLSAASLQAKATRGQVSIYPNSVAAFTQAVASSKKNDRILVCGSFQTVSDVLIYTHKD